MGKLELAREQLAEIEKRCGVSRMPSIRRCSSPKRSSCRHGLC